MGQGLPGKSCKIFLALPHCLSDPNCTFRFGNVRPTNGHDFVATKSCACHFFLNRFLVASALSLASRSWLFHSARRSLLSPAMASSWALLKSSCVPALLSPRCFRPWYTKPGRYQMATHKKECYMEKPFIFKVWVKGKNEPHACEGRCRHQPQRAPWADGGLTRFHSKTFCSLQFLQVCAVSYILPVWFPGCFLMVRTGFSLGVQAKTGCSSKRGGVTISYGHTESCTMPRDLFLCCIYNRIPFPSFCMFPPSKLEILFI